MRVMVFMPANADSESGKFPSTEEFAEMGAFNVELAKAGILVSAEGLKPTKDSARVAYDDGAVTQVIDGPFTESKELVAGFWIWQVKTLDEAIEWAKRIPMGDGHAEVELRPIFEMEDFGDNFTPDLRVQEAKLRGQTASQH